MSKPRVSRTFEEYSKEDFMPFIHSQLHSVSRLDVGWDKYRLDSVKRHQETREANVLGDMYLQVL